MCKSFFYKQNYNQMICLKNKKDHIKDQVFCKNEKNFEFSSPYITCNTIWIPAALSTFGGKNC